MSDTDDDGVDYGWVDFDDDTSESPTATTTTRPHRANDETDEFKWHDWVFVGLGLLVLANIPLYFTEIPAFIGDLFSIIMTDPLAASVVLFIYLAGLSIGLSGTLTILVIMLFWPALAYWPLLWIAKHLAVADPTQTAKLATGVALLLWWASLYAMPDPDENENDETAGDAAD